jgi:hypothetical protein
MESGGSCCTWSGAGGSAGREGLRWWTRLNPAELSDEVSLMSLMTLMSLPATEVSSLTPKMLLWAVPADPSVEWAGAAAEASFSEVSEREVCDWLRREAAEGMSLWRSQLRMTCY